MILLSSSRTRAKRLAEDLMNEELPAFYSEDFDRVLSPGEIMTGYGKVKKGYEYPAVKFVVISESDIFGSEKKKKKQVKVTTDDGREQVKEVSEAELARIRLARARELDEERYKDE